MQPSDTNFEPRDIDYDIVRPNMENQKILRKVNNSSRDNKECRGSDHYLTTIICDFIEKRRELTVLETMNICHR
jgi:hypothetical protein